MFQTSRQIVVSLKGPLRLWKMHDIGAAPVPHISAVV